RQGEFRSDLLYRLNTITAEVPPLRQRGDDILAIAQTFVTEFERRYGRSRLEFTPAARHALLQHSWPGNIRELRNVVEQASLMCARDQIDVADLHLRDVPALVPAGAAPIEVKESKLADSERAMIIGALRQTSGNVTLAARALGISRDTLRYRMEKNGLRREHYS
uniref:helix-turn-helix domain-containing protein n=1 Tax=Devosia sp. TaxID=1871048 RepID=UPI0035B43325